MNSRFSFIFAILVILLSSTTFAFLLTNDNYNTLYLCPKETGYFSFTLTGTEFEKLDLSVSGSAAKWATLSDSNLSLDKDQTALFTVYVTPDSSQGDYYLDININDKQITKKVTVKNCFNSDISALPKAQAVCPGELTKYQFTIFNQGAFEEDYKLSNTGDLNLKLSETNFVIPSGDSKAIYGYVQAPKEAGEYDIKVISESSIKQEVSVNLKVTPCYDYSVKTNSTSYNVCEHSSTVIPFTVENHGTINNNFKMSVSGADWAKMSKPVNVDSNSANKFYLLISPDYNQLGTYELTVKTVPEYSDLVSITKLNVTVRKCYDANLSLETNYFELCPGEKDLQVIKVKNLGEYTESFYVGKSNYNFLSFEGNVSPLTLNSLQSKELFLTILNNNTKPGLYNLGVGIKQVNNPIELESRFSAALVSKERCYGTEFSTSNTNINLYYNNTKDIYVDLKNNGLRSQVYTFSLNGTAASFAKVTPEFISVAPGELKEVVIKLKPNNSSLGSKSLILNVDSSYYSYVKEYSISVTENSKDIGQEYVKPNLFSRIGSFFYSLFVIESSTENPSIWTRIDDYKYHLIALIVILILIIILVVKLVSMGKKKVHHEPRIRVTKKRR